MITGDGLHVERGSWQTTSMNSRETPGDLPGLPGPVVKRMNLSRFKHYGVQVLAAMAIFWGILALLEWRNLMIIPPLGSSAFILFATPHHNTARMRNVLGGYALSLLAGCIALHVPWAMHFSAAGIHALAVGLSILFMVLTGTHHAPAAGAALAVSLEHPSLRLVGSVMLGAFLLYGAARILRQRFIDLPPPARE
jgi:CBS-domain-containing membrane protein